MQGYRRGQNLTEYGVVMALVVVVAIVGVKLLGQTLNLKLSGMVPSRSAALSNAKNSQNGSQDGGSGQSSGSLTGSSSGGGAKGGSDLSTSYGNNMNEPGSVQTAGGLGSQEQQQSNSSVVRQPGQNSGGTVQNTTSQGASSSKGSDPAEKPKDVMTHEQQLLQYSRQLMQLAKKFQNQYPELYENLMSLAQASQDAGPALTQYEKATVVNSSLGMGMAGYRRGIEQTWRTVGMSSDYRNLSPQDQAAISNLANASLTVVNTGMQR